MATPVDLVRRLLVRAGLDGHTVVPRATVLAGLRGLGVGTPEAAVEEAVRAGEAVADEAGLGLAPIAGVERAVARAVTRLVESVPPRLHLVAGPRGPARDAALAALSTTAPALTRVVADAELVGLRDWADLLAEVSASPDGRLVAAGDPAALPRGGRPAAGAVLADLVACGAVPVTMVGRDLPDQPTALGRLDAGLRSGRLPPVDPADHDVVVVPVDGPDATRRRVDQLVRVSIPRVYDVTGPDGIAVLTVRQRGPSGADALTDLCAGRADCRCVTRTAGRCWPAVVLVLPAEAAGSVTVPLLLTAVGAAARHVSVITGLDDQLRRVVAAGTPPPPRTRLVSLLRRSDQALTDPAVMPPTM